MKQKKLTLTEMTAEVNKILKAEYGGTMADLMIDENEEMTKALANNESPREWVDWYANKYGLVKTENFTMGMAMRVMGTLGYDVKVKGNKVAVNKKKK